MRELDIRAGVMSAPTQRDDVIEAWTHRIRVADRLVNRFDAQLADPAVAVVYLAVPELLDRRFELLSPASLPLILPVLLGSRCPALRLPQPVQLFRTPPPREPSTFGPSFGRHFPLVLPHPIPVEELLALRGAANLSPARGWAIQTRCPSSLALPLRLFLVALIPAVSLGALVLCRAPTLRGAELGRAGPLELGVAFCTRLHDQRHRFVVCTVRTSRRAVPRPPPRPRLLDQGFRTHSADAG